MRRSIALYAAERTKVSTGLVGLAVNPKAREECIQLFERMIEESKTFPDGVAYRTSVEKTAEQRLSVLRDESKTAESVEKELGVQMEELQVEALDELKLMPVMLQARAWEVPSNHEVPIKVVDF